MNDLQNIDNTTKEHKPKVSLNLIILTDKCLSLIMLMSVQEYILFCVKTHHYLLTCHCRFCSNIYLQNKVIVYLHILSEFSHQNYLCGRTSESIFVVNSKFMNIYFYC